ncbi:MAG: hypothetical protein ACT4P4_14685, partial [Betaproteobacteria bacterium]
GSYIERETPDAVCVSAVPPHAVSAAAELCRRLRKRFPQLRIVAGLWVAEENAERARVRLRDAGADEVATRLRDAAQALRKV